MTPPEPQPITTAGLQVEVSTTIEPGETVSSWVERHDKAVSESGPSDDGLLVTTYASDREVEVVTTERQPGESDGEFLERHRTDYLQRMEEWPPIP